MAIPKIPPILTESDWNKNKGLMAKAAGETKIGAMLKEMTAAYRLVKWEKFDIQKALKPGDSADRAAEALEEAQLQFKKVPLVVDKIEALEKQALLIQAQFAKNKLIPAASTKHVGKLAAAAKLFNAQVQMVEAEYEAFIKTWKVKASQNPTVKEVIGEKWFARLATLKAHKDPNVLRWSVHPEVALSAKDGRPNPELRKWQSEAVQGLKESQKGIAALLALRDKRMARDQAIAQVKAIWDKFDRSWGKISHSFGGGGKNNNYFFYQREELAEGDKVLFEAWKKKYPTAVALTERADKVVNDERQIVGKLNFDLVEME